MRRRKQNGSVIKNGETLRDVAFRVIGHPIHRAILITLIDQPRTVSEIALLLNEDPGYLVSPLRALRLGNLIRSSRHGRRTRYEIVSSTVEDLAAFLRMLPIGDIDPPIGHRDMRQETGRGTGFARAVVAGGANYPMHSN